MQSFLETWEPPGFTCRRGKVRNLYASTQKVYASTQTVFGVPGLDDRLIIVATDRISAFDWVLPTPIPDKGRVLTALSLHWFAQLNVPCHLLSADVAALGIALPLEVVEALAGRS